MLELSDVHTYYGASHVLQGVTLTVGPGEIVTILGRLTEDARQRARPHDRPRPAPHGRADRGARAPPGTRGRPRDRGAQARRALDPARRAEPAAGALRGRPRPHPEPRPDRALVGAGRPDGERSGQVPLSGRRLGLGGSFAPLPKPPPRSLTPAKPPLQPPAPKPRALKRR